VILQFTFSLLKSVEISFKDNNLLFDFSNIFFKSVFGLVLIKLSTIFLFCSLTADNLDGISLPVNLDAIYGAEIAESAVTPRIMVFLIAVFFLSSLFGVL